MTRTVVKLTGDLSFFSKEEISARLTRAEIFDVAVIDLTTATYVDSTILNCLAALKKRMRQHGSGAVVRIVCLDESLKRIFKISGMDRALEIYESIADAERGPKSAVAR